MAVPLSGVDCCLNTSTTIMLYDKFGDPSSPNRYLFSGCLNVHFETVGPVR